MTIIMVSTSADPRRPAMTYKVELPQWAFEAWWKNNMGLLKARNHEWSQKQYTYEGANSTFAVFHEDGSVEVHLFALTMSDLTEILQAADYDYREEDGRVGRPEKRVLVSTTSKDRRTGALVARQGGY